jgi:hypothetical protein
MTWPQYNDGKRMDNKLALKYAIEGIPTTFLIDRDGTIIGKSLRGAGLEEMVALTTSPWIKRQMVYTTRAIDGRIRTALYPSLALVFVSGFGIGLLGRGQKHRKSINTNPTVK